MQLKWRLIIFGRIGAAKQDVSLSTISGVSDGLIILRISPAPIETAKWNTPRWRCKNENTSMPQHKKRRVTAGQGRNGRRRTLVIIGGGEDKEGEKEIL